jgi:hypothetical protein
MTQVITIAEAVNVPGVPAWILPRRAEIFLGRALLVGRPPSRLEVEIVRIAYVRLEDLPLAVKFVRPEHFDLVAEALEADALPGSQCTVIHYAAVAPHKEA